MANQLKAEQLRKQRDKITKQIAIWLVLTIVMGILTCFHLLPFIKWVTIFCAIYTMVMIGTWLGLTRAIKKNLSH